MIGGSSTIGGGAALALALMTACSSGSASRDGGVTDDFGASDSSGDAATYVHACNLSAPAGSVTAAAPPPYSGGTCPTLAAGRNQLASSGASRSFLLVLPTNMRVEERLPVIFAWHWLQGTAEDFLLGGALQAEADRQRFIAVLPESKGDLMLTPESDVDVSWPFLTIVTDSRFEEELTFFDDMLSCVSAQLPVNRNCVGTVGISAGALFSALLVGKRSAYLASLVSISGGSHTEASLGASLLRPWTPPTHAMPALLIWGGSNDRCLAVNFTTASLQLEQDLAANNELFAECIHNCGHGVWFDPRPPLSADEAASFGAVLSFPLDHPYWLPAGTSPYQQSGLPPAFPSWCGIGAGSATPRIGLCPPPACEG